MKGKIISAYLDLSDEDKLEEAIRCVARGVTIPKPIEDYLRDNHLYDLIVFPEETLCQTSQQATCAS